MVFLPNITFKSCYYKFVYTTTRKRFLIFTEKKLGTHEKYRLAELVAYQRNTFKKGMLNVSREENTFHKERKKATKAVVKGGFKFMFST